MPVARDAGMDAAAALCSTTYVQQHSSRCSKLAITADTPSGHYVLKESPVFDGLPII